MSQITRTYTFTDGTTAYGSQVNTEIQNIVTAFNNADSASASWTSLSVTNNASIGGTLGVTGAVTLSTTLGVTGNATVGGTLGVTGATTLSGDLTVSESGAATINISSGTGTTTPSLFFKINGTTAGIIGSSGTTDQIITGSANGDLCLRTQGGKIRLSVDSGATSKFYIDGSGNSSFGGTINTALTASRVVKTDSSSNLTTAAVNLASTNEVTGTLPAGNGGTGATTKLIRTGTYSGNGGTQTVAHGLGATPDLVIISITGSGGNIAELFITGMSGNSKDFNGTNQTNGITGVDGTNITLGANAAVNSNSVAYAFIAIKAQ